MQSARACVRACDPAVYPPATTAGGNEQGGGARAEGDDGGEQRRRRHAEDDRNNAVYPPATTVGGSEQGGAGAEEVGGQRQAQAQAEDDNAAATAELRVYFAVHGALAALAGALVPAAASVGPLCCHLVSPPRPTLCCAVRCTARWPRSRACSCRPLRR
jgi:hypothetical protein